MLQNTKKSQENNLNLFKFPLLPSLAWAIIMLVLMTIPGNSLTEFNFINFSFFDKIAHVFVFLLLQLLLNIGFYKRNKAFKELTLLFTGIITFIYGIGLELLQAFLSTSRNADVLDIIANLLGILIAIAIFKFFMKKQKKIETS
jgi:glycopeptide antibiotics resistance protein